MSDPFKTEQVSSTGEPMYLQFISCDGSYCDYKLSTRSDYMRLQCDRINGKSVMKRSDYQASLVYRAFGVSIEIAESALTDYQVEEEIKFQQWLKDNADLVQYA